MSGDLPDAVLFDMDGTLIDSEPFWRDSTRAAMATHGYHLTQEVVARAEAECPTTTGSPEAIEDHLRYIIAESGLGIDVYDLWEGRRDYMIDVLRGGRVPLAHGAAELMTTLGGRGIPMALATNAVRCIADAWLDSQPGVFAVTVAGDEVQRRKPHPDLYLAAADALGVKPRNCLVIEDTISGHDSALAAGCRVIVTSSRKHPVEHWVPNLLNVDIGYIENVMSGEVGP